MFFHAIIITSAILGWSGDWKLIGDMVNEAFGYPVAAAVSLYLGGGLLEGGIKAYKGEEKGS